MFGIERRESREQRWEDFESEAMPHMPGLFRVAMWLARNRDEAEELVQETYMQALKSFHRYQTGTNCRAWLSAIMHNVNLKRLRQARRMTIVDDPDDLLAETIAFEPPVPQKLTDEEAISALRNIPEKYRQVIVLCDVEDFSYKEIASILDIPIGTVMSRLSRGRKTLRLELANFARERGFGDSRKLAAG